MLVHSIRKNSREEIRVSSETFKGHEIISMRVWYRDDAGEYRPGKQGLAFRRDLVDEVVSILSKAREVVPS